MLVRFARFVDGREENMSRLKTKEMKFFKRTAGYTLLHLKTNEIFEELGVESDEKKIHKTKIESCIRMKNKTCNYLFG